MNLLQTQLWANVNNTENKENDSFNIERQNKKKKKQTFGALANQHNQIWGLIAFRDPHPFIGMTSLFIWFSFCHVPLDDSTANHDQAKITNDKIPFESPKEGKRRTNKYGGEPF